MSCCAPSTTSPCPGSERTGATLPAVPAAVNRTKRRIYGNTSQSYTATCTGSTSATFTGLVSFDGEMVLTEVVAGSFDVFSGATQMTISGITGLDGVRTVTVNTTANTITLASYHAISGEVSTMVPVVDEFGNTLTDEFGNTLTVEALTTVPAGQYTVTLTATIGRKVGSSSTVTVAANTYYDECQSKANAAALAAATAQAEAKLADSCVPLYLSSDISYTATCPEGTTGSYTASVAHDAYSSTVSQAAADALAIAEATAEANASVVCTNPDVSPSLPAYRTTSGLWGLFLGDTGVTVDGFGNVSSWTDQSGNGNDASQSDATARPAYASNTLSGTNKTLTFPVSGMGTDGYTVVAVTDSGGVRSGSPSMCALGYGSSDTLSLFGVIPTTTNATSGSITGISGNIGWGFAVSSTQSGQAAGKTDGTYSTVSLSVGTELAYAPSAFVADYAGKLASSVAFSWRAIAIFDRTLSAAELQSVVESLYADYA